MAWLVLNCEGADPVAHELLGDIVMIGRAASNHIVIAHPTVSAHHALLLRVATSYGLKDLNSRNGTQINGALFTETELTDGDKIRFGGVTAVLQELAASGGQSADLEGSGGLFRSKPDVRIPRLMLAT
jgi:pSer/pThr/pTyr-binding forkhead associated (FHA) protein